MDRIITYQGNHRYRVSIPDKNESFSIDFAPVISQLKKIKIELSANLAIYHLQARPYNEPQRWLHGVYYNNQYFTGKSYKYNCNKMATVHSLETGLRINPHHVLIFPSVSEVFTREGLSEIIIQTFSSSL